MVYYCKDCGYLFQRVGEVRECPFCEGHHFRPATPEEDIQLQSILKKSTENEKEGNL